MQNFRKNEIDNKKTFGICMLSVLYVIMVTLIPIVGFGRKGSDTNTIIKAVIFVAYLVAFLFLSKSKFSFSVRGTYIILFYSAGQLFGISRSGYPVSFVDVLILVAVLFTTLFMLPAVRPRKKDIVTGIKLFVLFDMIAILYNIILHFDRFINFSFLTNIYYDMYSFFDNKNTYGKILFVTLILLFYWYNICEEEDRRTKRKINRLIYVQFFAIATSMCRTALLCASAYVFLNFIKKLNLRKIVLAFVLFFMMCIALCIPAVQQYVLYVLLRVDVDTFREPIVEASYEIIKNNLLFGCGQNGWDNMLRKISGNVYSHNGFLTVLMNGGIVYFVAYLGILVHSLICGIRICRVNRDLGSQFIIALITVIIYAFYESVVLCEASAANFAFTIAGVIIPQLYYNMLIYNIPGLVIDNKKEKFDSIL